MREIIVNHVLPGTIIVTDCGRGYRDLSGLGFTDLTANHSTNFIDHITNANTQLIENSWGVFKKKFRSRRIYSACNINDLFYEFCLKENIRKKHLFVS